MEINVIQKGEQKKGRKKDKNIEEKRERDRETNNLSIYLTFLVFIFI